MYVMREDGIVVVASADASLMIRIASAFKKRFPNKKIRVEWRD